MLKIIHSSSISAGFKNGLEYIIQNEDPNKIKLIGSDEDSEMPIIQQIKNTYSLDNECIDYSTVHFSNCTDKKGILEEIKEFISFYNSTHTIVIFVDIIGKTANNDIDLGRGLEKLYQAVNKWSISNPSSRIYIIDYGNTLPVEENYIYTLMEDYNLETIEPLKKFKSYFILENHSLRILSFNNGLDINSIINLTIEQVTTINNSEEHLNVKHFYILDDKDQVLLDRYISYDEDVLPDAKSTKPKEKKKKSKS